MANAKGLSLRGGQRPTWQSRSSRLHRGKVTGEIATAFPRLPRRFAPRNDTSGGYCGAPAPSSGLIPLCKALNERRYRRNRSVRFYRHLVRTGSAFPRLPRRFAPRNDNSEVHTILTMACTDRQHCAGSGMPLPYNGVNGRREYPEICSCQWRSLTAATDAIGAYHFNDGLYGLQVPSRDCHGREAPSQ